MVTRWGMGGLGLMALTSGEEAKGQGQAYSEATAARVDQEVRRLLAESYEKDLRQLSEARTKLDALVQALLQDESLAKDALVRILGARGEAPTVLAEPAESMARSD
jgi:cell division protease FtsH